MIKCIIILLFLSAFKMGNTLQQEHQQENVSPKKPPPLQRQTAQMSPENEHGFLLKLDDETIRWAGRKGPFIYAITGSEYLLTKEKKKNLGRMDIPTNSLTIIHNEIRINNIKYDEGKYRLYDPTGLPLLDQEAIEVLNENGIIDLEGLF